MRYFINFSAADAILVHDNVVLNLYAERGEPLFRLPLRPPYDDALQLALKSADLFVYALTPASLEDPWCARLYRQAAELAIPVAPVEVRTCEVPPELRISELIGLTSVTESHFPFGLMPGFVRSGRRIEPGSVSVAAGPVAGPPPHAAIGDLDLNSGTAGLMLGLQGFDLNAPDVGARVSAYLGGGA
ncbi:MAG TPA: hypothetical protein VNM14_14625 [Planctomycetota bacterium]|nr:hypothetical protein [Planctomycetota bacterium]